jgi:drug/metabolite transporter (DMT)-like permease
VGLLFPGLGTTLVMYAERQINVGVSSVLASTTPLITYFLSIVLLDADKFTWIGVTGMTIGIAGEILIVVEKLFDHNSDDVSAYLLVFAAAVMYASSAVFAKHYMSDSHEMSIAFGQAFYGALISSIGSFAIEFWFPPPPFASHYAVLSEIDASDVIYILYLGILTSVVSNYLYYYLISNGGPVEATAVFFVVPVVGFVEGIIFQHEWDDVDDFFKFAELCGLLCVLMGLALMVIRKGRQMDTGTNEASHMSVPGVGEEGQDDEDDDEINGYLHYAQQKHKQLRVPALHSPSVSPRSSGNYSKNQARPYDGTKPLLSVSRRFEGPGPEESESDREYHTTTLN